MRKSGWKFFWKLINSVCIYICCSKRRSIAIPFYCNVVLKRSECLITAYIKLKKPSNCDARAIKRDIGSYYFTVFVQPFTHPYLWSGQGIKASHSLVVAAHYSWSTSTTHLPT